MTEMNELYEEMKAALTYFGLRFCDMNKVEVTISNNKIIFTYGKYKLEQTL